MPSGSFKYKKAAEFLMNTIILGIKGIVKGLVTAHDAAEARATAAEASVTQVCVVVFVCRQCAVHVSPFWCRPGAVVCPAFVSWALTPFSLPFVLCPTPTTRLPTAAC